MGDFYSKCGEFLQHAISMIPNGVGNDVHVIFYYTNGRAEYNGRSWKFQIFNQEA